MYPRPQNPNQTHRKHETDKYNQKSEYFEEGMVSLGASKELKDVEEYHNDIHVEEDGSENVVFSAEPVVV